MAPAAESSPPPAPSTEDPNAPCLGCHGDSELAMTFPDGEALSLSLDEEAYRQSVHGDKLNCLDCHEQNRRYPHPLPEVSGRREYAQAEYELCKRCHFKNYTLTLDSVHFEAMSKGFAYAPLCTDCHTAHTMTEIRESRTQIAEACSKCHRSIYEEYASSIHGSALLEENPDVPVCTTCHGVHNIPSATTASFRLGSLDLCAGCHANKELMDKYGISSNVLKTYLDDFHGKTAGFYQKEPSEVWPETPVCADCHGVHDIKSVDDPESQVIKENLLATCRKCHPDASANFPSAWLSHYEPSLDKAPLVYLVKMYYRMLIPFMVGGLALYIMLDLWRLARNR
ncbi:MAG: hypothetical protein A2Y61_05685 [Chloroflexi bacterium RBG_13_60_13]|nr:MAG: hypothetical protein A2Y61_05685 [Chloroflexi bacterium RBG_13_60_13]